MKRFTTVMLLGTAASIACAASAQAQTKIPFRPGQTATAGNDALGNDRNLLGTGASSVGPILVQELNCIGGNNRLGSQNGTTTLINEPTNLPPPPGGNPFNCAVNNLQDNFGAKYISTGSSFGRRAWRTFANQFQDSPGLTGPFSGGPYNPFNNYPASDSRYSPWPHVQFAFADSSITDGDLTEYDSAARPVAGAPVFFPLFVLPVAIAYNPVYGVNASGQEMRFDVQFPQSVDGEVIGGLRMTRQTYCKVFNGETKNFNSSLFTSANNNVSLQDKSNDTTTRWNRDGVPIRLVGRLDGSGTTDIFTRAMAAQCKNVPSANNRYANNAEALPYARGAADAPDFSTVRADSPYRPGSSTPVAGTRNLVSNQYFNGSAITSDGVTGGSPATPNGVNGSGLFLMADGSGRVRDAINFAPDYPSPGEPAVLLNGKIGYISADFIANSPTGSNSLYAAALQVRSSSTYTMPTAANATAAFGTVLPPQSNANGTFTNSDTRQVREQGGTTGNARRTNPLAWYDVLYAGGAGLSDPSAGYAITGTTQFIGYTCYTQQNREHIVNFLGWNADSVTRSQNNVNRAGIFTGTGGLLAVSNIGALPTAWKTAIYKTFLVDSNESGAGAVRLGSLNLWLQNKPTPGGVSNSTCSGVTGA